MSFRILIFQVFFATWILFIIFFISFIIFSCWIRFIIFFIILICWIRFIIFYIILIWNISIIIFIIIIFVFLILLSKFLFFPFFFNSDILKIWLNFISRSLLTTNNNWISNKRWWKTIMRICMSPINHQFMRTLNNNISTI